jgi:hypothetical protein
MRWVTGINMTIAGNAITHDTIEDFIQLFRKNTLSDSTAIQVLIPAAAKVIGNARTVGITYPPAVVRGESSWSHDAVAH